MRSFLSNSCNSRFFASESAFTRSTTCAKSRLIRRFSDQTPQEYDLWLRLSNLLDANIDQRNHVLDKLRWSLFNELRLASTIVNRLHLLDHDETCQRRCTWHGQ